MMQKSMPKKGCNSQKKDIVKLKELILCYDWCMQWWIIEMQLLKYRYCYFYRLMTEVEIEKYVQKKKEEKENDAYIEIHC